LTNNVNYCKIIIVRNSRSFLQRGYKDMKKIKYILKEEMKDMGFGETKIFNVYLQHGTEEILDCSFGIKEKAEKYIEAMNI
jgi:hypothetical protein